MHKYDQPTRHFAGKQYHYAENETGHLVLLPGPSPLDPSESER